MIRSFFSRPTNSTSWVFKILLWFWSLLWLFFKQIRHSAWKEWVQMYIEINWRSVSASYVLVHEIPLFFELLAIRGRFGSQMTFFRFYQVYCNGFQHIVARLIMICSSWRKKACKTNKSISYVWQYLKRYSSDNASNELLLILGTIDFSNRMKSKRSDKSVIMHDIARIWVSIYFCVYGVILYFLLSLHQFDRLAWSCKHCIVSLHFFTISTSVKGKWKILNCSIWPYIIADRVPMASTW